MSRIGHIHIYTTYKSVDLVISLPRIPYMHRVYMVLTNPSDKAHCDIE